MESHISVRDKAFLEAVEAGAKELKLQNPDCAVMVIEGRVPGYSVAMLDIALTPKPKAELMSIEFIANRPADLRRAIKDAFTDNDRKPNRLVFSHGEDTTGRKPKGVWTMIDPDELTPVIFGERLVTAFYGD